MGIFNRLCIRCRIKPNLGAAIATVVLGSSLVSKADPEPEFKRFVRGQGDDPRFHSFVVPLDFQKGIELHENFFVTISTMIWDNETYPWFLGIPDAINAMGEGVYLNRIHLGSDGGTGHSYVSSPIANPIVAFGSAGGGTPLYVGKNYRFGFYAGGQPQNQVIPDELRIRVFAKSDYEAAENVVVFDTFEGPRNLINLPINFDNPIQLPRFDSPEWDEFAENGYVKYHTSYAADGTPLLESKIEFLTVGGDLASDQWGTPIISPLIITHRALPGGEDYFYRVDYKGITQDEDGNEAWMVVSDPANPSTSHEHSLGYTMDFDQKSPNHVALLETPHFSGEPLPPIYHGKSVKELTETNPPIEIDFGIPDADDFDDLNSTELLMHSELEKFVAEMGGDPIALANFVINEILLTDALAYSEDGVHDTLQVNDGGLTRGALATFLEGQGSPSEQCALLVYLLRSAGYQAAYVVPPAGSMEMLTPNLSRILEMQIRGTVDSNGDTTISEGEYGPGHISIPVNYPWVAYYDQEALKWRNVFPWLKDTEIVEGLNLYDYLPAGYNSPYQWIDKYLTKDPRVLDQIYQQPDSSADSNGMIAIEAEGFFDNLSPDTDSWEFTEEDGASGAGAMQVLSDDGTIASSAAISDAAELNYHVNFSQAGTYFIWVRGKSPDASGNTVHIGVDDTVVAAEVGELPSADFGWVNDVATGGPAQLTISSPGVHTLNLWMHEDGAIVDKIVLTKEADAALADTGPPVSLFESGASTENPLPDDMVATVMKTFIDTELRKNHPEVSIDDLGVAVRRRKQLYSRWEDFPQPWSVDATAFGATPKDYLVNGFDQTPDKFNTLRFSLFKDDSNTLLLSSPVDIPAMFFHNRRFLFRWEPVGSSHRLVAVLSPYDRAVNLSVGNFSDSNYAAEQRWDTGITSADFGSSEGGLRVETVLNRHRSFTNASHSPPGPWGSPFNYQINTEYTDSITLPKGSLGSLCFNFGRVSERMLRPHLEEIWEEERSIADAGAADGSDEQLEAFQGITTHLMGMSYYHQVDRSLEFIQRIHKYRFSSLYSVGFAKMDPWKESDGSLPNGGEIYPDQPLVDMHNTYLSLVASGDIHPEVGMPRLRNLRDYTALFIGVASAHEHGIINQFWKQSDSISTVNLLHQAGQENILTLTASNYETIGNSTTYGATELKNIDSSIWAQVVNVLGDDSQSERHSFSRAYYTPGVVEGAKGDYAGVGAMILAPTSAQALISGNRAPNNGGAGRRTSSPGWTWSTPSTPTIRGPALASSSFLSNNINLGQNGTISVTRSFGSSSSFYQGTTQSQIQNILSDIGSGSRVFDTYQSNLNSSITWSQALSTSTVPSHSQAFTNRIDSGGGLFNFSSLGQSASRDFIVASNSKNYQNYSWVGDPVNVATGEFYIDEVDLTLPGPFPLNIRRNYGSLAIGESEFGYGWKLAYFPYLVLSDDESVIYAAETDGSVVAYEREGGTNVWRPTLTGNPQISNTGSGLSNRLNGYIEIPTGETGALGERYVLNSPDGSQRTFRVREFPTSGIDRRRPYLEKWEDNAGNHHLFSFYDDAFYGSQSDTSLRGSEFGLLRRIEASNGNFLGFHYDTLGHITEIFTRDGRRVFYEYDQYGDLIAVERPDASIIRYDYLHKSQAITDRGEVNYSEHLITRVTHPGGRILENEYDDQRRVTTQYATLGAGDSSNPDSPVQDSNKIVKQATYDYSGITRDEQTAHINGTVLVNDPYNRQSTFVVTHSRISSHTDPLGISETTEWYADDDVTTGAYPRAIKRRVDRRGLISEFKYDSAGNLTETKLTGDLDGDPASTETSIATAQYTSLNTPSVSIDRSGNSTHLFYDDSDYPYHPTRVEKRASGGSLISHRVTTYTESGGGANAPPFARGLVESVVTGDDDNNPNNNGGAHTDPNKDHALIEYEYSDLGFLTRSTTHTGTADPVVISEFDHNLRGELIEKRDLDGGSAKRTTLYGYDDMGRRIWDEILDESGAQISWNYAYYNQNGELEWSDGPRYNPEDYVYRRYDRMGRPIEEVAWRSQAKADGSGVEAIPGIDKYAISLTAYNLFGSAVKTTDPRGNTMRHYYDDAGRRTGSQAYEGDWENGGTLLSSESFTYEDGGQVEQHTNPLGGITRNFYTATGQPRRQENPDGTVLEWRYGLDGRVIREPVSHNTYWDIAYDDANRQVSKTLKSNAGTALGVPIVTTVDRRGNVISTNDQAGNVTTTRYDDLNRVVSTTGPPATTGYSVQQFGTVSYDAVGFFTIVTNALGEKTKTSKDTLGRTIGTTIHAADNTFVRESYAQYSSDFHSVQTTDGSGAGGIVATTYTNNAGQTVLVKGGPVGLMIYSFDAAGNTIKTVDARGLNTNSFYPTTYTYDGLNRIKTTRLFDGTQTSFSFDAAGNLLQRHMPGGAVEIRTYDTAGRVTATRLEDGSQNSTRSSSYTYHNSGVETGLLNEHTDGRGVVHSFVYDEFSRLRDIDSAHPTDANLSVSRSHVLDARGLATSITENTLGGSQTSVIAQSFDEYGQLYEQSVSVNGNTIRHLTNVYDAAGRRLNLDIGNSVSTIGAGPDGRANASFSYQADGAMVSTNRGNGDSHNYSYATNGLLQGRTNPLFTKTLQYTADGHLEGSTVKVPFGSYGSGAIMGADESVLSETVARHGDGRVWIYWCDTRRRSDVIWTEQRSYGYNTRNQLTSESFSPVQGASQHIDYQFDGNQPGGPGVRTAAIGGNGNDFSVTVPGGGVDGFQRVITEDSNNESAQIAITGNARSAIELELALFDDISIDSDHVDYNGPGDPSGAWATNLDLSPGYYFVAGTATHASLTVAAKQERAFSIARSAAKTIDLNHFDEDGNATRRNVSGGKDQIMSWDALGRLIAVTQRDGGGDGLDWTAVYDAFNRRIETTTTPVSANVADTDRVFVEGEWYDPLVEFLSIAVETKRGDEELKRTWKVIGPDANGSYGSLQGIGGVEALVGHDIGSIHVVSDLFGHIVGYVEWKPEGDDMQVRTFDYSYSRYSGYGPLPDHYAPTLYQGASLARALGWRGSKIDPTGFYFLGERYYEPNSGRFLSADPLGHAESLSLYCYAGGDPINFVDPTGRGAQDYNGVVHSLNPRQMRIENHFAAINQANLYREFNPIPSAGLLEQSLGQASMFPGGYGSLAAVGQGFLASNRGDDVAASWAFATAGANLFGTGWAVKGGSRANAANNGFRQGRTLINSSSSSLSSGSRSFVTRSSSFGGGGSSFSGGSSSFAGGGSSFASNNITVFRVQPRGESNIVTGGAFRRARERGASLVEANTLRLKLLGQITSSDPSVLRRALKNAQASGTQSPVISTTFSRQGAFDAQAALWGRGIDAEVLTITGPRSGGIDFNEAFESLGGRTRRFQDAELQEFGIPDLFIPSSGTSRSGFQIIRRQ